MNVEIRSNAIVLVVNKAFLLTLLLVVGTGGWLVNGGGG